ncbi:3-dehydroquinate synthase [Natronocella acetinitrilica]|uniref:3-dehydroquinate synthase n=1 Tax=Natronocella acetinitrilica TaxID=414046 RepID=A0AAE3G6V8_9GAMM|nr:3-dehydroquinate synthase [Natronocella acetinitrilica]MCP1676875.1 3-dehydroquinate synthase [Natronocella acetinitrilica]
MNKTQTLMVELGDRSYPIVSGAGLLNDGERLRSHMRGERALIVTTETVARHGYADQVQSALGGSDRCRIITLPDGEEHKNLVTCMNVYTHLLEARHDRKTTLIAVGGGVVGDLTGFVAATYQRGVDFIQVPTTLLAQVDSSVGGKTGVNHPLGKNMIGAFHQPRLVLADTDVLQTLPDRELSAGLAEVIKYGLIRDPDFFTWLEQHMDALLARDTTTLAEAILISCRVKADVVAADETEQGMRAILNLGHTFGHAIETASGYGNWLHGEAVGAGMAMAAWMSHELGWLDTAHHDRVIALIRRAGLPVEAPTGMTTERFMELMAVDKKAQDGRIRLVLQQGIGHAVVTDAFSPEVLSRTLARFTSPAPA